MWENMVGFYGVVASICTGVVIAQAENGLSGWENVSAIAILGMTLYFLLTRMNDKLEKLSEHIHLLQLEIKIRNEEDSPNE